ncbi:MAG: hypothetical protein GC186_01555 [Rhodobacteraceae bacterium]|nr:hypothetical protein [Paracoccaceae bacterium]
MKGLLAAVLVCLALAAQGETVIVRSGEHDGFSRLVLPMEAAAPWQFGRTLDGYELRLGRPGVKFDLSKVFDRIPRLRLADLGTEAGGTRLTLQLSCACHAEVFEFRPSILVIDIRPGPPPSNSPFERSLEGGETASTTADPPAARRPRARPTQDMPVYDWRANAPALPSGDMGGAEAARPTAPTDVIQSPPTEPIAPSRAVAADTPPPDATDPHLSAARAELVQQLGRAASQGLLSANPQAFAPDIPVETQTLPPPPAPPDDGPPVPASSRAATTPARLSAQTALDREVQNGRAAPITPTGGPCLPDSLFDLPHWGDNRTAARQIEERRAALVGEFDRPSVTGVGALMRLYLYLGFGAEARSLPAGLQVVVPDADVLAALGDIMDEGYARRPGRLAGQAGCSGAVSLWSVLAAPEIAAGEAVDVGAVTRSFSALPLPLRRLLGPGLSGRFLDHGDLDTARAIRDAITRAPGAAGPAVDLLNARIDLADGRAAPAEAAIRRVAVTDDPASPDALVMLVDTEVATGGSVDRATIDSIAALAHQFRGTATGRRLTRAHLLALGLAGDFDGAIRELATLRALPDAVATGADALWALLADRGSDEALLRHGLNVRDATDAARKTHVTLAKRLIGLGFPDEGLAWLAPLVPPTDAERLLAARAWLATGDTNGAVALLDGLVGAEAAELRAEVAARDGDHSAASAAYLAVGATKEAGEEAWQAGDWQTVRTIGAAEQQAAVAIVGAPDALAHPSEPAAAATVAAAPLAGPLAQDRALVDGSVKARGVLQALLASTEVPPAATP